MTSWIILLIKQYIDIAKYLLISDAIFDLNNDKKKRTKEKSSPDSCVKCYTMFLPFLLIKIDVFS